MVEPIQEVFYETRHHATGRYSSSYPPQQDEDDKGGLLSLLSLRGVKQLKGKWDEHRHLRKFKKWVSIFVSPRGDLLAVASGNKITVLRKDDDYTYPCGIYICHDRLATFTHGAWSDSHDVLGVIDENETLYFIKPSGEEITRITKRQLKVSASIIGLIVQGDLGGNPLLCTFSILASDGLLHHIEVGQGPTASASAMQSSIKRTSPKNQFPQSVSCVDYNLDPPLLVVVDSPVSVPRNSRDNTGFYCISLWHITRSLDLELVFCSSEFEGLFSIPKGYVGPQTLPKVVISPQSKFIAVLDLTGCLNVYELADERRSLSVITFDSSCCSEMADDLSDGGRTQLNSIADCTWWSYHILILATMTGVVIMVDILSGRKLLQDDKVYSLPVLERVKLCQGCIFLLESTSVVEGQSPGSVSQLEKIGIQGIMTQDRLNTLDVRKLSWSLISFSERSVIEMYNILIANQQYQLALDFASRHGLDKDEIFKSEWLHSVQGTNEIDVFLSNIKDEGFVISECLEKVGPTEDAVRSLYSHGLRITDKFKYLDAEDTECFKPTDFRMARLQLLQFRDRLETFLGINMGRFSVPEYTKFRSMPLSEVAVTLAESGKIGALNLLFKRHPYSMAPFMLEILAAIPETVPVQTYGQLLPGRSPPTSMVLRDDDWVECTEMINFICRLPMDQDSSIRVRTESIVKQSVGVVWPSVDELSIWYKTRARDIDSFSGQLDNCLYLVEYACRKGLVELQPFHDMISYLQQLIYADDSDEDRNFTLSLVSWEQLSDYEKFKMMINRVRDDKVVERLREKAIPFMLNSTVSASKDLPVDTYFADEKKLDSFLVRWLKEIASDNKLDLCASVIEDGCREFCTDGIFRDETEAVECALQCIYLCSLTDGWNTMASILSKLPTLKDSAVYAQTLLKRVQLAEGHIEVGRLLAFYQVPKPMSFFLEAHLDEKVVKQILRLILSKFGRRQPGRADNDWANMWRDMQCFQEKAFLFLDIEYMLMEFCRGLLKAGKFSLARNYLKGTSAVSLATEKAENLVIQAAREYLYSASSLSCTEIWKAKECLNLIPNSKNVKAEADIIEALTVKLPELGVTILPLQFRQIREPMEIINTVITSQTGAYLNVDEILEVSKLLGLKSPDETAIVQEAVAREAAVAGDLQIAFDLCLILARKGHGQIWDLCAAIGRGPFLDNMDTNSRKQLLGFALCHCDEESIGELLHAWKDLDMQSQCEKLTVLSGTNPPNISVQGSSILSLSADITQNTMTLSTFSDMAEGVKDDDRGHHFNMIKGILSTIAKDMHVQSETNLDSLLLENGKLLSFATIQLPWLLELSRNSAYGKKLFMDTKPSGLKRYTSVRTQALVIILSWLARNDISPRDDLIASIANSIMETPVAEDEDILGCSFLLNLVNAFHGVQIIEDQLKARDGYEEICSIMNVGMTYSSLHNSGLDYENPTRRRELLLQKFQEKQTPLSSDAIDEIDKVHSTFWREWKSKLEEKKLLTDQSRELEQIIPGVDSARFLSRDHKYIENVIFSTIGAVKMERKPSLKKVLKLADTYGVSRTEVLLQYVSSILVSEVWENDDIVSEFSDHKREVLDCSAGVITTITSNVYPMIDGRNKERLSYVFGILSDCYLQLKETEEPLPKIQSDNLGGHHLELAEYYKILEQECIRVSFIKKLNFKNIAGLEGLNIDFFNEEVCNHIDEFSVEALAEMVRTLLSLCSYSSTEGLMSWQAVYKHYILSLLTSLVIRTRANVNLDAPDSFQGFISELEQNYSCARIYIRVMSQEDILEITKQYYKLSLPFSGSFGNVPGDSAWLILLLNFWIRLTDDMQDTVTCDSAEGRIIRYNAESLLKCLQVFLELWMEEKFSAEQGWVTVSDYVMDDSSTYTSEVLKFCKAMVLSGCRFEATYRLFSEAIAIASAEATGGGNPDSILDLSHLYVNILDSILLDLANDSHDCQNLHHLLSTLSKLECYPEDLKRVRFVVWKRLSMFSNDMQFQSHVRVYALELMQLITGRNLRGLPAELVSNVQPWEGWDDSLDGSIAGSETSNAVSPNRPEASNKVSSALVALKSSRLVATISPDIEVSPNDLNTVESAVSCFVILSAAAKTGAHCDALVHILEEWEGLFIIERDGKDPGEECEGGKNNWSSDEWDEGWESFQEEPPAVREEKKDEESGHVHPLHTCWVGIIKKLFSLRQFKDIWKLIDRSLSRSNVILLDEEDSKSLSQVFSTADCFTALKFVLLLPYQAIQIQYLDVVEAKLKEGTIFETSGDLEIFALLLSSGIMSTIVGKSSYSAIFSYACHSAGHFSRLCQDNQLPQLNSGEKQSIADENDFIIFRTVLLPGFVLELVKAKQPILGGFIVSQFMRTHASFSLVNVVEASLRKYLEGQMGTQQSTDDTDPGKKGILDYMENTVLGLRSKLRSSIQSALSSLQT